VEQETSTVSTTSEELHRALWPGSDTINVCTVCGTTVAEGDINATNGWRWFSDGRGELSGLCPSCPTPAWLLADPPAQLLAA